MIQVKIAAAHALAQLPNRDSFGTFLQPIWSTLLRALEQLDEMASMDEYKYRENLETQLKCTLVQVCSYPHTTHAGTTACPG